MDESEAELPIELDAESGSSFIVDLDVSINPRLDIPAFVDDLTVGEISDLVERQLALQLDLVGPGYLDNWQNLAHHLGMTWEEIRYLKERVKHPGSPTCEVLYQYRRENLGRVLRLIRDDLRRIDVIINIMPALLALEESLKLGGSGCFKSRETSFNNTADSGFSLESTPGSSVGRRAPNILNHLKQHNTVGIVSLKVSASREFSAATTPTEDLPSCTLSARSASSHISASQQNTINEVREGLTTNSRQQSWTILLSYYKDNSTHMQQVERLRYNLTELGKPYNASVVTLDEMSPLRSQDNIGWITDVFKQAKKVIVVISAGYQNFIAERRHDGEIPDFYTTNSIFLCRLLNHEYCANMCQNFRFLPVMFHKKQKVHLPPFLSNTVEYVWPEQHDALMSSIFEA